MKKEKEEKVREEKNFNLLLFVTFLSGVLLIVSTYAWFYASLNVRVNFFNIKVTDEKGLFISLDGINFGSVVEIDKDYLINGLSDVYPNNSSQWARFGLFPVSTIGIKTPMDDRFSMYQITKTTQILDEISKRIQVDVGEMTEEGVNNENSFIAFDIFLKNASGAPFPDNLYLDEGTSVVYDDTKYNEDAGTINSLRIGFLKMSSVPHKTPIEEIQNITCNNDCEAIIYEPNHLRHSEASIERAEPYGVKLINGQYNPTYAVYNTGRNLELSNGQEGSYFELDEEHFTLQNTRTDFTNSLFEIPNGITKVRIYIWLEGQDMDGIDTQGDGAFVTVTLNLIKDLAGYRDYE